MTENGHCFFIFEKKFRKKKHLSFYSSISNCLAFTIFIGIHVAGFTQNKEEAYTHLVETRIEYLIEQREVEVDYTTIFDQLYHCLLHPLNLNKASVNELRRLYFLTDIQINHLLEHIEKNGALLTLEELQSIKGFDLATIRWLLPFAKVVHTTDVLKQTASDAVKHGKSEFILRYQEVLEQKEGYQQENRGGSNGSSSNFYLGSPAKIYARYRYKYNTKISFGITAEKDPGEAFFSGNQKNGFDFYSAHLFLKDMGKLKQLAIGDFHAQFGQGLTFWSGQAFGASVDITATKRSAVGLKPYLSSDENRFLRGIGTCFQLKNVELTTFYAAQKVDANVVSLADSLGATHDFVSSFPTNGFHRTPNEFEDKDRVRQQQLGAHLAYKKRKLNVGLTMAHREVDLPLINTSAPYQQFRSTESSHTIMGVDYNWVYQNFNFFGEVAHGLGAGIGVVSGFIAALDPEISITVMGRNYSRNFQPIVSNAVGANNDNVNERGVYMGTNIRLTPHVSLAANHDYFSFSWLKHGVHSPSEGRRYMVQLNYQPTKRWEMYFRIRQRNKQKNNTLSSSEIPGIVDEERTNYRIHFDYQVTKTIRLKSRLEWLNYQVDGGNKELGFLIYQDLILKRPNSPFSLAFRYAMFDTDSYSSRIYAYENDVLYAFSVPAYYHRGIRTYLTMRYKASKTLDLWLRYGLTQYDDIAVIGSGLEEIQGNRRSEIKLQARYKF